MDLHLRKRAIDNKLPLTRYEHLVKSKVSIAEISRNVVLNETIDLGGRLLMVLYTPYLLKIQFLFDKESAIYFQVIFCTLENYMISAK